MRPSAHPRRAALLLIGLGLAACSDATNPTRLVDPSRTSAARDVAGSANLQQALAPQSIVRSTGAPATLEFIIRGFGPAAVLHVRNGDDRGAHRATSGEIMVDGVRIVDPSQFKQSVASFDVPFALGNPSTLAVRLEGAPGSSITISVDAQGATSAQVGASGGTAQLLGTQVSLTIPAGALSAPTTLTATPVSPDPSQPSNANLVGGSAVEFGPEGTQFNQPITVTLKYDPSKLPARFTEAALRLGTLVNGRWEEVKGGTVDPVTHTVTGQTPHFSTYGVIATETFTQITMGESDVCGLTADQDVYCWGRDDSGELGTAGTSSCVVNTTTGATVPCTPTPTLVPGGLKFQSIAAGGFRTCGISTSGDAYCWGRGAGGRIGDGGTSDRAAPTLVAGGLKWTQLSAGTNSACGLTTSGSVYCWGVSPNGETGGPTSSTCVIQFPRGPVNQPCSLVPTPIASPLTFTEVSVGLANGCAVASDHSAWCWGWGVFGANGDGTAANRFAPVQVAGGLQFAHVSAGAVSSCGVTVDHVGYCWGTNQPYRLLGIGTAPNSFVPAAVSGGLSFDQIAANGGNNIFDQACGLTTAGELWCWGGNDAQQLGRTVSNETCTTGTFTWPCQNVPIQVAAGHLFRTMAVSTEETCATATDGETYCLGNDEFGQIGDGTIENHAAFTRVPRP